MTHCYLSSSHLRVKNEVDLVPLACEDGYLYAWDALQAPKRVVFFLGHHGNNWFGAQWLQLS